MEPRSEPGKFSSRIYIYHHRTLLLLGLVHHEGLEWHLNTVQLRGRRADSGFIRGRAGLQRQKNFTTLVWWRKMVEEIAEPSVRGGNCGELGVQ